MNYIKHMNKVMELFYEDERLQPSHITLYLALFQAWNQNRFTNPFPINRNELMKAAKISSFSTYTRCLTNLMTWKYLEYIPSFNPSLGSKVHLYTFCTGDCKGQCTGSCTNTVQLSVQQTVQHPYININTKHNKQIETARAPTLEELNIFFKEEKYPETEAEKFFNHFESNGWLVGGKSKMKDWRAGARNWMLNSEKFEKPKQDHGQPRAGILHTGNDKDYSEPL
jgi:hypothetical protein